MQHMQLSLCALLVVQGVAVGQSNSTNFQIEGVTYATTKGASLMLSKTGGVEQDPNKVTFMLADLKELDENFTMATHTLHINVSQLTLAITDQKNKTTIEVNVRRVEASVQNFYLNAGTLKLTYDISYDAGHYGVESAYNLSVMAGDVVVKVEVLDWSFNAVGKFLDAIMMVKGSDDMPMREDDPAMPNYLCYKLGESAMLKLPKMMAKGTPFTKQDMTDGQFMMNNAHFTVRMPKDAKLVYAFVLSAHQSDTGAAEHVSACALSILAAAILQKFLI